jgi:hypothetical protein
MNQAATASSFGGVLTTTSLAMRNRAKASDGFGLISITGYLFGADEAGLEVQVRFAGAERRFKAEEVIGARSAEGSLPVEFHLLTHLAADGVHKVEAELIAADGTRTAFPPLPLETRNDSPLARQVAEDLRANGTPAIIGRIVDSGLFPYDRGTAKAWFNADVDDDVALSLDPAPDAATAQRHLLRWGFCVLHEQLPDELVESFRSELSAAIKRGDLHYRAGSSDRIHQAHQKLPSARAVWLYPPVLQFLEDYFKDTPCACQTLTYVNGSEQNAHQDSIHLTPYPNGFMCGVWVALEDVQENSGELYVYPGSHRSGSLRATPLGLHKVVNDDYSHYRVFDEAIQELIRAERYDKLVYRPKAGQILVWHENLIHGGSPRIERDRTRLSVVSHYFARGAIGYYDSRGEAAALETLDRAARS